MMNFEVLLPSVRQSWEVEGVQAQREVGTCLAGSVERAHDDS